MNEKDSRIRNNKINRLYYVALLCAKEMAGLPATVTDTNGVRYFGNEIKDMLDVWFERRETPGTLKYFWFRTWIIPASQAILEEEGFERPNSEGEFFSARTNEEIDCLLKHFEEIKDATRNEGINKKGAIGRFIEKITGGRNGAKRAK
jgi:hypothetical protein